MLLCYVCDQDIDKDTAPLYLFGEPIHPQCDIPEEVLTCNTANCMWRWCEHAGECVV